jgi:hypothetical protein
MRKRDREVRQLVEDRGFNIDRIHKNGHIKIYATRISDGRKKIFVFSSTCSNDRETRNMRSLIK